MTHLKTPIKRSTDATYQGRPLVIQIEPPDIIRVKEKGRRTWYIVSVEEIFSLGAKKFARQVLLDKQKECDHKNVRYGKCTKCKKIINKKISYKWK
jgi:hypothetical protein